MAVSLTERAAQEVRTIIEQQGLPENAHLRMAVKGGGCSGFTYSLDLTEHATENDETFDCHGVQVVVDPKSYLYLNGTSVDFKEEMMGRGFVFNNPNATNSCGCGSSFSA